MQRSNVFMRAMHGARSWTRPTARARPWLAALFVFGTVLTSLTLHEVVPRYHVHRERQHGRGWQNHPTFLIGDCPYYRATLLSIVHDGDLNIRNNFHPKQYQISTNVALGARGEWYPKHTILMPIAAIPFYWVARDKGLIAFNLVQLSALITLIWVGARRYTSSSLATALTLWYAFGTMLHAAAYNFAPDVFSSLLVMGALVAALFERSVLAGLLLGLSVWAKWTNVVFLPLPVLLFAACRRWPDVLRVGIAASLPVLGLLALNQHMFGSPLVTPYDRVLVEQHGQLVMEASHRTFFSLPFWGGVWDQLMDRDMGLLVACPPIVLAPIGLWLLIARAPAEALYIASACAVQVAAFAKYEQWRESSYGPRFLMTALTMSALLVAPVFQRVFMGYDAVRRSR